MTQTQAVRQLAEDLNVTKGKARRMLENAAEQLDQDDETYSVEDCYNLAIEFYHVEAEFTR